MIGTIESFEMKPSDLVDIWLPAKVLRDRSEVRRTI
jgi:hypothetical protein